MKVESLEDRRVLTIYDLGFLTSNYVHEDSVVSSLDSDTYYYGTLGNSSLGDGVLLEYNPQFGALGVCLSDPFGNNSTCVDGNVFGQAFIALNSVPGAFRVVVGGQTSIFGTGYRITLGIPSPVPVDLIDTVLPNNSPATATNLNAGQPSLTGTGNVQGTIHYQFSQLRADEDWFSFDTATTSSTEHFLGAEFVHNQGDIELKLFDSNGVLLAASTSSSDIELIGLNGLPAGRYFIQVYGANGQVSPGYRLSWKLPDVVGDHLEPNNTFQTATEFGLIEGEFLEDGLSILPSGDEDWFHFAIGSGATNGHEVEIQFLNARGDVDIALFDAAGNPINYSFSTADTEVISLALLPAGEYFLAVFGFYGSTNGEYQLRINAPVAPAADSTESKPGPEPLGTLSGEFLSSMFSLHTIEDVDRFTFTLNAGATGNDGVSIVQPDTKPASAILLDSNRNVVGIYDTEQNRLGFSGLSAGNYELVVFSAGGVVVPQYRLRFTSSSGAGSGSSDVFDAKKPNNTAADATDLGALHGQKLYGQQFRLSIGSLSDEDWYRFTLTETAKSNAEIQIAFDHDSGRGDLDIYLYRTNADGSLGTLLDQSTGTSNSERISLEGLAAGNYLLQIKGFGGKATGPYQMQVFVPGPDGLETPRNDTKETATDIDQIIKSKGANKQTNTLTLEDLSIDKNSDQDWFKFTLQSGTERFEEIQIGFLNSLGDIDAKLFDSTGTTVVASSTGTSDSERIDLKSLPAGTYYLQVYSFAGIENPNYRLVFRAAPSALQDPFEPNNARTAPKDFGKIDGFNVWGDVDRLPTVSANDEDWYRFETAKVGNASSGVLIAMDNLDGDLDLELYDSAGTKLDSSANATNVEWISLQNRPAGVYFVRVIGHAGATSPGYVLAINSPWIPTPDVYEPNNTSATATALGTLNTRKFMTHLSIDTPTDVDQYTFRTDDVGIEGQFVAIAFDAAVGDLALKLYNAAGTLVGQSNNSESIESVSLAGLPAGQYRIEVSGEVNQYVLSLFGPASNSGDLAEGPTGNNTQLTAYDLREIQGTVTLDPLSLHQVGDVDWYKFTIPAGTTLSASDFVAIEHNARMGDLDVELYNSAGTLLQFQNSSRASKTGEDIERVTLEGLSSNDGPVFIKVFGHQNAENPSYRLTVHTALDQQDADWAEPNEAANSARDLQRVSGTRSWVNLNLATASDKDWFKFSLVEGTTLTSDHQVSIEFDGTKGDLNLRLYKANDLNTPLRTSLTSGNREVISLAGLTVADGPFFLQVDGDSQPIYTLQIVAPELLGKDWAEQHGSLNNNNQRSNAYDLRTPQGTVVMPNLSIDPANDVDYFKVTLSKPGREGDEIQISYRENLGKLNLQLENTSGTKIRDGERKTNLLRLSLKDLAAGEYFVRIAGETSTVTNPNYQLTIAVPREVQQDFAEQNDTPATATDLSKLTLSRSRDFSPYLYDASLIPYVNGSLQSQWQAIQGAPLIGGLLDYHFIHSLLGPTVRPNYTGFVSGQELAYIQQTNSNTAFLSNQLQSYTLNSVAHAFSELQQGYSGGVYLPALFSSGPLNLSAQTMLNAGMGLNMGSGLPNFTTSSLLNFIGPGNGGSAFAGGLNGLGGGGFGANPVDSLFQSLGLSPGGTSGQSGLNAGFSNMQNFFGGANVTLGMLSSLLPRSTTRDVVGGQADSQGLESKRVLSDLSIHSTADVDWFRFELESVGSETDALELSGVAGEATLTMQLYSNEIGSNAAAAPIQSLTFSGTLARMSLAGIAKGVYYVKISSNGQTQSNYELSVSLQPAPKIDPDWAEPNQTATNARDLRAIEGTRIFEDLTLHNSSDADWFTFQTLGPGTESEYVRVDGLENSGDIDLKLFASDGRELKSSVTSSRSEQINLSGLAAGTYRIQVYGYQGSLSSLYNLMIVAPTIRVNADSLEPNNSISSATPIAIDSWQSNISNLSLHSSDVDYFKFDLLAAAGSSHTISLSQPQDAPGALIEILNGNGNVVRTSVASGAGQSVSMQGLSGTVFARIRPVAAGTTTEYALHWDLPQLTNTQPLDEWTIMVYMTASNLEKAAFADINEMESALLPSNVNLVVFLDQTSGLVTEGGRLRPALQFSTGSNGVWGDSALGVIQSDFNPGVISTTFQRIGERNSGASDTLAQFIAWTAQNAPAKHYGLVLWDHGSGVRGSNVDNESGDDFLTIPEARAAIQSANVPLSLVAYDACLMGTAEVGYAFRDLAKVIVSSQEIEEGDGYDYRTALSTLTYRPDLASPEDIASGMVASFAAQYVGRSNADTLASLRASAFDSLADSLSLFVTAALLQPANSIDWKVLRDGTLVVPAYGSPDDSLYRDLGAYMRFVATYASPTLKLAAINVGNALNQLVINKTMDYRSSQGQSILLPAYFNGNIWASARNRYLTEQAAFASRTQWAAFLDRLMVFGTPLRGLQDPTGSNGNPNRAFALGDVAGGIQTFQRLASSDGGSEWYRFMLSGPGVAGDEIRVGALPSAVYLYAAASGGSGTALRSLTGTGSNRKIDLAGLSAGEYLLQIDGLSDASKTFDFTFAVANKPNSSDRATYHDTASKSLDLGVVASDRLFTGYQLNGTTEDWFEFQNPRQEIPTNRVLRIQLAENASAKLELYRLDPTTRAATSIGVKQGSGELSIEFPPGENQQYRFMVKPVTNAQNIPYHIVIDAQGADRFGWTNPINNLDVDHDNTISPLDVLAMINDINQNGSRGLGRLVERPEYYLDVDSDGSLAPLDILTVINYLNTTGRGGGGGEGEQQPSHSIISEETRSFDNVYASWSDTESFLDSAWDGGANRRRGGMRK